MPRISTSKHPLALLRKELGLIQKELADIAGVSTATVQSIELGRLGLSERLASKISDATGVSMSWLLEETPKKPIPAAESRGHGFVEYTKQHFERAQAKELPEVGDDEFVRRLRFLEIDLLSAFRSASKRGEEEAKRCMHRVESTIEKLSKSLADDFGNDLDFERARYDQLVKQVTAGYDPEGGPSFGPLSDSENEYKSLSDLFEAEGSD